jgi:hypothetical protein
MGVITPDRWWLLMSAAVAALVTISDLAGRWSRHPLDRSAAFTVLLEFCPWFGKTESRAAEAVVTRFLAAFYASGETVHGRLRAGTGR